MDSPRFYKPPTRFVVVKTDSMNYTTVLQRKKAKLLKVFKLHSKALLSSYLHIQIIAICMYTACAVSFSFSIYLLYLRRVVVTSQIICDVPEPPTQLAVVKTDFPSFYEPLTRFAEVITDPPNFYKPATLLAVVKT